MNVVILPSANQVIRQFADYPDVDMKFASKSVFETAIVNVARIPDGWMAYCVAEKSWFFADKNSGTAKSFGTGGGDTNLPVPKEGYDVSFEKPYIYNSHDVTDSQNTAITFDFTNAKIGQVQKMYHNGIYNIELPDEAVRIGSAPYVAGQLNIVYLEFVNTDRVEYWIVQEG